MREEWIVGRGDVEQLRNHFRIRTNETERQKPRPPAFEHIALPYQVPKGEGYYSNGIRHKEI